MMNGFCRHLLAAVTAATLTLMAGASQAQDLTLNINDAGFDPIPAGGIISYDVRVQNGGNSRTDADNILFSLPAGAVYTGTTGDLAGCTPPPVTGPGTISCDIPELAPRAAINGKVQIQAQHTGVLDFTGSITSHSLSVTEGTTVTKGADLSLDFIAPAELQAGEFLSFRAVLTNNGPYEAEGAQFTMLLPGALSSDIAMPPGCAITGNEITCEIAENIPVGVGLSLDFSTQILTNNDSNITVAGSVRDTIPDDPDLTNNAADFTIAIHPGTDVSLGKSRAPSGLLYVGQPVEFTLTPNFVGTAPLAAEITDALPANYQFVSVTPSGAGWTCIAVNPVLCTYEAASPDPAAFRAPITITALPVVETETATPITNTAWISSPTDVVPDNNAASDQPADIVTPSTDLVAHKSGPTHGLVTVGNDYDWRISTSNAGNIGFAGHLHLTEIVPQGLRVTAIDAPAGWGCDAGLPVTGPAEIQCSTQNYTDAAPLAVGATTPAITVRTTVLEAGPISNGLRVSDSDATYQDRNPANNQITSSVTSGDGTTVDIADLSLVKTVTSSGPYDSGAPVSFQVVINNAGPGTATDVRLSDQLNDLYFADSTTTAVTLDAVPGDASCSVARGAGFYSTLTCTIPELPADTSRAFTFTALAGGNARNKTNTAETWSTQTPDPNYGNNAGGANYNVVPRTDVTVEKTASHADGAEVRAGQSLIYVISARVPANGLSAAENVTVTDRLPAGLKIATVEPSQGSCAPITGLVNQITAGSSTLSCNLGTISNGNTQTVTIKAIPTTAIAGNTVINEVSITTDTPEVDGDNNSAAISHIITRPLLDLVTNKTDSVDPAEQGSQTVYTVTVQNIGPSEAFNLRITDVLPAAGMQYDGFNPITPGLTCAEDGGAAPGTIGGQLICELPNLPVGQTAAFEVMMTATQRGQWVNHVEARSDEYDDETLKPNNDASEATSVFDRSNLAVTKAPSKATVDLMEAFTWNISVENRTVTGIGLAENVVLRDTLPANMAFTGDNVTTTGGTCDVSGRELICILPDMAAGDRHEITVPVQVTEVAQNPQQVQNTATVTTDSFDINPDDNSATSPVEVLSTEVSGTIWRDFDENSVRASHDSGVANLPITLTGAGLTRVLTTDAQGEYRFGLLPPGEYAVSYTPPSASPVVYLAGVALPGPSTGASADGQATLRSIMATTATPAAQNDFTLIPQARLALSKNLPAPVVQDDGTYRLNYTFRIANNSQEAVDSLALTDVLQTDFGTYTASATPDQDEFTVIGVTGATLVASADGGFTLTSPTPLIAGGTQIIRLNLLVNPPLPRESASLTFTNTAEVTGTGVWSGQTVTDMSNNGGTPLHGESSPTTRVLSFAPQLGLTKTASLEKVGADAVPGDVIRYSFTLQNTGNTPLTDIAINDPLPGLIWDSHTPIARLDPRASDNSSFTAHYELTQADIEAGIVDNTATASGRWAVDGVADPMLSRTDNATIIALAAPALTLTKAVANHTIQNPTQPGDTIRYSFTVANTGNVALRDLLLTDLLDGITPDPADGFQIDPLPPAGEVTVHAEYTVTQDDIDAGQVVNRARIDGTHGPGAIAIGADSDLVTTPLHPAPAMQVVKLPASIPPLPQAGDEIHWTIHIENTGNTRLEIGTITEPLANTSVSLPATAVLEPGMATTATATHPLTQAEIDTGQITNQVTVAGKVPGSDIPFTPTVSGNDPDTPGADATVAPLNRVPSIALVKRLTSDVSAPLLPGEVIEFEFTIRNTGNVTLSALNLTDSLPAVVLDDAALTGLHLPPQGVAVMTGSYQITAADIAAGGLTNTAMVTALAPDGAPVTDVSGTDLDNNDPTLVPLLRDPQVALIKTIRTAPGIPVIAGDIIEYAFEIHNIGNVGLRGITLTDQIDAVQITGSRDAVLPVGEVDRDSFTGTYELTQVDIDAGIFTNTALVNAIGTGPDGNDLPVADLSGTALNGDDPTVLDIAPAPALSIVKAADGDALQTPTQVGDLITYHFTIANTGNVTLHDVTVNDPLLGGDLDSDVIASMAPGTQQDVTASYAVTQSDIEAGRVENIASASGNYVERSSGNTLTTQPAQSNPAMVSLHQLPSIDLVKTITSAPPSPAQAGDPVTYGFTVTNTGNVELTDIMVIETLSGALVSGGPITLAAGALDETSFTASYNLTQADIEAGSLDNQAVASGLGGGLTVSDLSGNTTGTDQPTPLSIDQMPEIRLTKTGDISGFSDLDAPVPGDVIRYGFTVENTGNIILHDVIIDDPGLLFDTPLAPFDLAPGATHTLVDIGGHALTQADINAGFYENTATAKAGWGNDGSGNRHPISSDATVTTPLNPTPGIDLVKRIDLAASQLSVPPQAGDMLIYGFTIENTGNVTLHDINLDDPLPGLTLSGQLASLAPGLPDSTSFTATYRLTQADIEHGQISNQARATGIWAVDSDGTPRSVSDLSGTDTTHDDPTVLTLDREAALSITKSAEDLLPQPTQPGDVITYHFTVRNDGNVTLDHVTVSDPLPGLIFPEATIPSLAPGQEQVLTATYPITQADIDAGQIDNIASITGSFTDPVTAHQMTPTATSNEVATPLLQHPRLAVVKTATPDLTVPAMPEQLITYDFTIMNTGNTTLTDVVLRDPLPGLSASQFDLGDLLPGEEISRSATYQITQEDIDAGRVLNQATVSAMSGSTPVSDLSGPDPVSDEGTVVPLARQPGLVLVKTADATALTDPTLPGQQIAYSFTVQNTGNVTLEDVTVSDPLAGLAPAGFGLGDMAPGASVAVGPALYALTQADINLGHVQNRAFAAGNYGPPTDPGRIETPSITDGGLDIPTLTPLASRPAIAVIKTVAPGIDPATLRLGEDIRWQFSVANTGNVPLTGVTITEDMADVTVTGGPVDLAVGATDSTSFTAVHIIDQADLDSGRITNSARATGYFSDGPGAPQRVEDISGSSFHDNDPTISDLGQQAAIDLVKTADISGFSTPPQAGDLIHYSFNITNTGSVTLRDITLTDPMPGLDLAGSPIPSLAPGAVNSTAYSARYHLTQADIDGGDALQNQASVTGSFTDGGGNVRTVAVLSGTEAGGQSPTIVTLPREPGLRLEKTADGSELSDTAQAGENITFDFALTNTGNVTLTNVTVDDPLPGLRLSGAPIPSLAPGQTSRAITGRYAITTEDIRAAELVNTATPQAALWHDDSGKQAPVTGAPSSVTVPLGYPEIALRITIGDLHDMNGDGLMGPGDQVLFRFEVMNTGTVPLRGVTIDPDSLSLRLTGLSCGPISLNAGESRFLQCTGARHSITPSDVQRGEIRLTGEAIAMSDAGISVRASSQAATVPNVGQGGVMLEKLAGVETAMIGDLVPYTIRIGNSDRGVRVETRLEDHLPAGFSYQAGSARLDGQNVDLIETGRTLVLEPITLTPGQTRTLTLLARVGGSVRPGAHDNRARLISPASGRDIAEPSKASVQVRADAVLQCATVLGRVFDDSDQNGHMNPSLIERGLPKVRLIAPNGLAVATDEHGRFSVPCAALPRVIGSNFMLKLDERSLPSGYRMTTENPRVVRLTPGMITRLDFGATLARLVRIDLAANAFDGDDLGAALTAGLHSMVAEIRDKASMLRITYLLAPDEPAKQARQRLRLTEKTLRALWRHQGKYKLNIETLIHPAGETE